MIEVKTPPVTPERVTPLKPSEALRLGRLLYPRRISGKDFDGSDGACAIGAIRAGAGVVGREPRSNNLWAVFPGLMKSVTCPLGAVGTSDRCHLKSQKAPGSFFVSHLNDQHDWSDRRIADWLEGLGL